MPSINEVWEQALQINANLVTVHHDVDGLEATATDQLHELEQHTDWLEAIHITLNDGFANLSDGLAGIQARQDLTNALLKHQILQNQTIICLLDKIAHHTCDLLTESDQQTRLQRALVDDVDAVRHMEETVHPDAALELQRAAAARRETERCCPPPKTPPRCTFEPCPSPGKLEPREPPRATDAYRAVRRERTPKQRTAKARAPK